MKDKFDYYIGKDYFRIGDQKKIKQYNTYILIIGAARCGKTTLARKLNKKYGYSVISIDDIVSGLQAYPELNIHHDGETHITTKNTIFDRIQKTNIFHLIYFF